MNNHITTPSAVEDMAAQTTQDIINEYQASDSRYQKNDNYGKPKSFYLGKAIEMDDQRLFDECKSKIWLSAYASNNSRSDYHWHCDFCYDECKRRNKPEIYTKAHKEVSDAN